MLESAVKDRNAHGSPFIRRLRLAEYEFLSSADQVSVG
jgi:hypothetical protein